MDVWEVLADPTRRAILRRLADGEATAGELAGAFDIARPGVSRHLRVLRESGLVDVRDEGRRRYYSLRPEALADVDAWHEEVRSLWRGRLDALDTEVARGRRSRRTTIAGGTTATTHEEAG